MPIPRRVAEASLRAKGFEQDNKDHRKFHLIYQGRRTGGVTFTSHGRSGADIPDSILNLMKRELWLDTLEQLRDLLNCPMDHQQYIQFLLTKGVKL
jgi:hypothetical protein